MGKRLSENNLKKGMCSIFNSQAKKIPFNESNLKNTMTFLVS